MCSESPVAPDATRVENPAFDVTPHRYVTAIITERGVARAPFTESLRAIVESYNKGDAQAGRATKTPSGAA